jgi:LPS sulfotransferase NodH
MVDLLESAAPVAAAADQPPPILLTGAPRSGTTWAGNVIGLAGNSGYIHEPFNPSCPKGRCRAGFARAFTYVTRETEGPWHAALADTLAWRYSLEAELAARRGPRAAAGMLRDMAYFAAMRRRRARVVVKDPTALFAAAWLAERFGAQVVVVIRHPAAFVASLRAAGWGRVPFAAFADQPRLLEERLAPHADAIRAAAASQPDPIAGGTLLWTILHHHIARLEEEHPDWIFVRHEDLSRDPEARFAALYARLGLDFTPAVRAGIAGYSTDGGRLARVSLFPHRRTTVRDSTGNLTRFRQRLSAEELDRIRRGVGALAERYYGPETWSL